MRRFAWLTLTALTALAEPPANQDQWEEAAQFDCIGPFTHFSPADVKEKDGFRYEYTGATVKLRRDAKKGKQVKLGLLAGIKDLDPETKAVLARFFGDFDKADVDAIVIGGDTASDPQQLEDIYRHLTTLTTRPLLVIAGNMERGAALNYALTKVRKETSATNLVNMDLVRRADFDGADVVSLGGYHDKHFLHVTGGCVYTDKHVEQLESAAKAADDSVVLLTHGPMRQKGQQALDYVPGAENVGDPRLTAVVQNTKIPFGITGHILEAAGKGADLTGHPLPPKKPHPQLFVNQGSANPLPWKMNDGSTAYGLGALMTIDGRKASYEILRGPKPSK
ncbi:MAG: metallophosphoesterase [Myxococcaceae bacterium]|nr:metallophosphoesterase [Myxococcaceae bacterium]